MRENRRGGGPRIPYALVLVLVASCSDCCGRKTSLFVAWGGHHLTMQGSTWHWLGYSPGQGVGSTPGGSCSTDAGFHYLNGPPNPPGASSHLQGNCSPSGDPCYVIEIPSGGKVEPDEPGLEQGSGTPPGPASPGHGPGPTQWGGHHLSAQGGTYKWMGHLPNEGVLSTPMGSCDTDGGFVYTISANGPGAVLTNCGNPCPSTSDQTCNHCNSIGEEKDPSQTLRIQTTVPTISRPVAS